MTQTNGTRSRILITVSGPDHPGITAALTAILAQHESRVLDMEQVVVQGRLNLSILIAGNRSRSSGTLKDLLFAAKEHGSNLDFRILDGDEVQGQFRTYVLTLLGTEELSASVIARVSEVLATNSINIEKIQKLNETNFETLEMTIGVPPEAQTTIVHGKLLETASACGIDLALQPEGFFRRAKRLVVFDLDCTLIQGEMLDILAEKLGIEERVRTITQQAMDGEIDFENALRQRIGLLKGVEESDLIELGNNVQLTPGASELLGALKRLGFRTAIISGGLLPVAKIIARRLGLNSVHANQVDILDGRLTGTVREPILDAQAKARIVRELASHYGITLDQVIAVGDGANDVPMLEAAGLGIAFHAKPAVRKKARHMLNRSRLDSILFLLGIRERDLQALRQHGSRA